MDKPIKPAVPVNELVQIVPEGWPQPVYNFENNEITKEKFVLGRELFYEEMLSSDNTISCGSCHQAFAAFANEEHNFSHGVNGLLGNRNAPPVFNVNWHPYFMWDGGINHIEVQPLGPIANPVEMNENINTALAKLSADAKYKKLFKDAYGDEAATTDRLLKSMSVFMGMMYSYQSKYDHVKRGEEGAAFTSAEQAGYIVFQNRCASCHTEPLMSDFAFRNNGLSVDPILQDSGRMHITNNPNDRYKFKTPTLRNIMLTGPYMHDGRFSTIDQVLDHYQSGIVVTSTLDPQLNGGITLTVQERNDLKEFLKTLTDYEFINDTKFFDPN